jgi:hypothetical protein
MRPVLDKVSESVQLPTTIAPGPNTPFLLQLILALRRELAQLAHRVNEVLPKDGSELTRMLSLDSVTFPEMTGDVDDADTGYYSLVKFVLTGSGHTLSGIVGGSGQEGVGGRMITLVNASASDLTLTVSHEDVGSATANQFRLPRGFDVAIGKDMAMTFWYDPEELRWRVA